MRRVLKPLEEPYRSRAVPPGTAHYWSWLFATRAARDPLLGVYALMAEWRALMDPGTDVGVAHVKLGWWREEIRRLAGGSPVHPITRYIAASPRAGCAELAGLQRAVEAAAAQVAGVPLERAAELESHANALYGAPLLAAAALGGAHVDNTALQACIAALAAADYLARAVADHARETRAGRVPFPVDELLAAGIDDADLSAGNPPPRLQIYLERLRLRAAGYFTTASQALPSSERPALRHLSVLAALGMKHLNARRSPSSADFHAADLYNAWSAARRAAAAR